ncbi:hypothetical protein ECC02_003997 [Trypanosoma cruzi]|uniref:Uncharacterized protein n=1 Tax=Trypanosoma cruzi TaxID=5693 RepID=A0A7J6Y823_TRYCR|nr:hypothetical protein ECC02_003997 [Trypanosoma cruzi]
MAEPGERHGGVSGTTALRAVETVPRHLESNSETFSFAPPVSAQQWMEVSMFCLQNRHVPLKRLLQMLEDTAKALMDEKPLNSQSSPLPRGKWYEGDDDDSHRTCETSDAVSTEASSTVSSIATPQRQLAARFFMLASHLGIKRGTVSSLRAGVRLAEMAVDAHRCTLTTTHLAWACYYLGYVVQEREGRSTLETMAGKLVRGTLEIIAREANAFPTDFVQLVKLAWLMALLGEIQSALALAQRLVGQNRADANALVLLSLLFSATGEYDKALEVANHTEQVHPQYILGGIVLTMMRYVTNDVHLHKRVGCEELLAILVARVQATTQYTSERADSDEFRLVPDIGTTVIADGCWSSRFRGASRVAGHWALLAYVAVEVGCTSIAEIAVRAGLEFVGEAREEHRKAYADLICCSVRIKIDRMEKIVETVRQRHMTAGVGDVVSVLREFEDEQLIREQGTLLDEQEVRSLHSLLFTALEVCTAHADSYVQLGRLYLLEALKANQPQSLRTTHLVEASHYFQLAIDSTSTHTAAYEGMGRVREAQGAMEMSLDFLSSAAKLAARQPVIPFERFLYIFP